MSRFASILSALAVASAHNYASGQNLRVREQRRTFCTTLSFNGSKRNPSPADCERAARTIAFSVCEGLKSEGVAGDEDDSRCMTFLNAREAVKLEDCSSQNEAVSPLFVRTSCPRFGYKKPVFSVYDLIASIPFLDSDSASRARFAAAGTDYNYFDNNFWVFERETRCHGLVASSIVAVGNPECTQYYHDEDQAVCNYLKTILDDLWDLGCVRTRTNWLALAQFHCAFVYNVQLDQSQAEFCTKKGPGEDVSCDAVNLICGSKNEWNKDDVALAPYFLDDALLANYNVYVNEGEIRLEDIYSFGSANDAGLPLQSSLDYLQHAIKAWRPPFATAE